MHLTQLLMISQSRLIKIVAGVLSLLCVVGCDFAKMKKCPSYVATYIDIQGLKLETTSDKMSVEVNPSQGFSNEYDFCWYRCSQRQARLFHSQLGRQSPGGCVHHP